MRNFRYDIPAMNPVSQNRPEICLAQPIEERLDLNGSLVDQVTGIVNFGNYSRSIRIEEIIGNVSNVPNTTFLIEGTQNGVPILEEVVLIEGGAGIVESEQVFDTISAISRIDQNDGDINTGNEGDINPIRIVAGGTAYFPLVEPDLNASQFNANLRIFSNNEIAFKGAVDVNNRIDIFSSFLCRIRNGLTFADQDDDTELQPVSAAELLPALEGDDNENTSRAITLRYSDRIVRSYFVRIRNIEPTSRFSLVFVQLGE